MDIQWRLNIEQMLKSKNIVIEKQLGANILIHNNIALGQPLFLNKIS